MKQKKPRVIARLKIKPKIFCAECGNNITTECPKCGVVDFYSFDELLNDSAQIGFIIQELNNSGSVILQASTRNLIKLTNLVEFLKKVSEKGIDTENISKREVNRRDGNNILVTLVTIKLKNA